MTVYKWLLIDADGTLFDFDRAEQMALKETFSEICYPYEVRYLTEYRRINRQIWLDFEQGKIEPAELKTRRFALLFKTTKINYDPQNFSTKYLANLAKETFLMDGAEAAVESLSTRFNIAIITNGLANVQRPRLGRSSLSRYFKAVIISEEVGAAKPDPQIFDVAFEQMNHPAKREVLIIGDSLSSDIQGGRNYGIDTCWFNPDGRPGHEVKSTFEIQTLAELPTILGTSNNNIFEEI